MFDRQFFSAILPEHVRVTAARHPEKVPVIELHLGDRTILDLCHIVRLADTWVAVAHFCGEEDTYDDYDVAFLPYGTIVRVELTMKNSEERHIGFSTEVEPVETPPAGALPDIVVPTAGETGERVG